MKSKKPENHPSLLNRTHSSFINELYKIWKIMQERCRTFKSQDLIHAHTVNSSCKNIFENLINTPIAEPELQLVHHACRFVFEETACFVDDYQHRLQSDPQRSAIFSKLHHYQNEMERELPQLTKLHDHYCRLYVTHSQKPIDCLILTSLPKEFMAVARRLDYYLDGSSPQTTKGFPDPVFGDDDDRDRRGPGWVRGIVKDGQRKAIILLACQQKYGPTDATQTVQKLLSSQFFTLKPKHVLVVGIAGNLDDGTMIDLGDIGISREIKCVDTAKLVQGTTQLQLEGQVSIGQLPEGLREYASFDATTKRFSYVGVVNHNDIVHFQSICSLEGDKQQMAALSEKTRSTVELEISSHPVPCPQSVIEACEQVKTDGRWKQRIQLKPPVYIRLDSPRVEFTKVVSSPFLVKQTAARDYIKEKCRESLLIEMESAGACKMLPEGSKAVVIKAACDWAKWPKDDKWHLYCADVAAAFAIELALELASQVYPSL